MPTIPPPPAARNAGGPGPVAPRIEVSDDLVGLVAPAPLPFGLSPPEWAALTPEQQSANRQMAAAVPSHPDGYDAKSWLTLRRSDVVRQADALYRRAFSLQADMTAFVRSHGPGCEADAVVAAGHPAPADPWRLSTARHHFAGASWALEQVCEAVKDVIPEPAEADEPSVLHVEPSSPHSDRTDNGPIPFAEYFARVTAKSEAGEGRATRVGSGPNEKPFRLRQYGYESSPIYRDAWRIKRLAERLRDRMAEFADGYDGTEGVQALAAVGAVPPAVGDFDETADPAEEFENTRAVIAGHLFNLGELVNCLPEIEFPPVRRRAAA